MIRAYCLLGAATLLVNGPVLTPLIGVFEAATLANHAPRPAPPPSSVRPSSAFAVEADKGKDGLFRVTGIAEHRRISFIVDTGATVTVLSARDADALGLPPARVGRGGTLRTAGGSAHMVWQNLPALDIAGSHLIDIDVVVVDGGSGSSLLGQDVLERLGTVTLSDGRLQIKPLAA